MAKIVGIDLGTTYSAVSVWDEKRQQPVIIPNLRGAYTTPSVVSLNDAGEVIVGEDAKQNLVFNPTNTVSQIKREMGRDFKVTMGGKSYNPQTISAFILRYLKLCAESYLGEPVHDAVISVPAYFTEVQHAATRDAGRIAGLNVHRVINEPTAAAVAFSVNRQVARGDNKMYAVFDLGGGTFDVSIIDITAEDITVLGTGGDPRLGGQDMDEQVMRWALQQIWTKYGADFSEDEAVRRRLMLEAEEIKKRLVIADLTDLNVPFMALIDGRPLNVRLPITRTVFEGLIQSIVERALVCLDAAVVSAETANNIGWRDLDGLLLVGGPTRLPIIRRMIRERWQERCPGRNLEIRCDVNPDEVVALGAAIVAGSLVPIGHPPEAVEEMALEKLEQVKREQAAATESAVPSVQIYDVTGHSLGIAVEGVKLQRIINKETVIPITQAQAGFTNAADFTDELLVEVYQGEEDFVAANTKVGEVRITGLEKLPRGQHVLEVKFTLDVSGTLSTVCTDLRTRKTYEGSFKFDGITRMDAESIRRNREEVEKLMAGAYKAPGAPPAGPAAPAAEPMPPMPAAAGPAALTALPVDSIPKCWRGTWDTAKAKLAGLPPAKQAKLIGEMNAFAHAMAGGNADTIEERAYSLQDTIYDVIATVDEGDTSPAGESAATSSSILVPPEVDLKSVCSAHGGPIAQSESDPVSCTVFAPPAVGVGQSCMVQVFAHVPEREAEAGEMAREMDAQAVRRAFRSLETPVTRGTRLTFELIAPGLVVDEPIQGFKWGGHTEAVQFGVTVPAGRAPGNLVATVIVAADSVPVGQVKFLLAVVPAEAHPDVGKLQPAGEQARRYRTAFVSYASRDRAKVLARVQMLRPLGIRFFQDVLDLEPGERFGRELFRHIDECDLFLLFWSRAARESEWVLAEVRYALARKGDDEMAPPDVMPVIIEGPPVVEPPPELAHLHFNDRLVYFLAAEEGKVSTA
jgi:molecular chaperone DnaK